MFNEADKTEKKYEMEEKTHHFEKCMFSHLHEIYFLSFTVCLLVRTV